MKKNKEVIRTILFILLIIFAFSCKDERTFEQKIRDNVTLIPSKKYDVLLIQDFQINLYHIDEFIKTYDYLNIPKDSIYYQYFTRKFYIDRNNYKIDVHVFILKKSTKINF